jgi:hypothetical protein
MGEDYAMPGHNALALETNDPQEFLDLFETLRVNPTLERALRRAGRVTAQHYAWSQIMRRILFPRLRLFAGFLNRTETPQHGQGKKGHKRLHIAAQLPNIPVLAEADCRTLKGMRRRDRAEVG